MVLTLVRGAADELYLGAIDQMVGYQMDVGSEINVCFRPKLFAADFLLR